MTIVPAIDLLDGACVRLHQGDYGSARSYDGDPVAVARRFASVGAKRIHLVDLNAARADGTDNRAAIAAIRRAVSCSLEVGGGVRSEADVAALLDAGVDRLIVGTLLAREPDTVAAWVARYGGRFVGGIDARDGVVKVSGWESYGGVSDTDLAARVASTGITGIIYTNISRDGTLSGPDIARTRLIGEVSGLSVVLSGGIGSARDIDRAVAEGQGRIAGAILGRAYYEGRIDLEELFARHVQDEEVAW